MSILFYKVFCSKSTWIRCNICSDSTWSKSLLFTDYSNPEGAGPTKTTVLTSHWRSHLHIHKTRDIRGTADKLSTCPSPCQSVDLCPNPSRHMQWPPSNPHSFAKCLTPLLPICYCIYGFYGQFLLIWRQN